MKSLDTLEFDARFAALGSAFSATIKPTATQQPKMVICSTEALALLDLPPSTALIRTGQWRLVLA